MLNPLISFLITIGCSTASSYNYNLTCYCTEDHSKFCVSGGTCDAIRSSVVIKKEFEAVSSLTEKIQNSTDELTAEEELLQAKYCVLDTDFMILPDFKDWEPACFRYYRGGKQIQGCSLAPKHDHHGFFTEEGINKRLDSLHNLLNCSSSQRAKRNINMFKGNWRYCRHPDNCNVPIIISSSSSAISQSILVVLMLQLMS